MLKAESQLLDELSFDIKELGFSEDELDTLFLEENIICNNDELLLGEIPENPISKLSDVWFIDNLFKNDLHPMMKPPVLIRRAICNSRNQEISS